MVTVLLLTACAGGDPKDSRRHDPDDSVDDAELDRDGDGVRAADGDCDDDDAQVYPGAPDGCDALDQDCDGESIPEGSCGDVVLLDQGYAGAWEGGSGSFSFSLEEAHTDYTGDGVPDVVAYAHCTRWPGTSGCAQNLLVLPSRMPDGFEPVLTAETAVLLGDPTYDWMVDAGAAGDFDGDGWEDLFYLSNGYSYEIGRLYIVPGPPSAWPGGGGFTTELTAGWWDDGGEDGFVFEVAGGEDVDGDGRDDLLLTTSGYYEAEYQKTWLLSGRSDIAVAKSIFDEPMLDGWVRAQGMLPDMDGDGLAEAAITFDGQPTYLGFLAPEALGTSGLSVSEASDYSALSRFFDFGYHNAPADLGDIDEDGYADASVYLTELYAEGSYVNTECYAVLPGGADLRTRFLDESLDRFVCVTEGDEFEESQSDHVIPDLDGDGHKDLLVRGTYDVPYRLEEEQACILASTWMPTSGRVMIEEVHPYCFGLTDELAAGAGVADLDGDGLPEFLASDSDYENNGIIYVAPGFEIPFGDVSKW
jgi:hypothetical protein